MWSETMVITMVIKYECTVSALFVVADYNCMELVVVVV